MMDEKTQIWNNSSTRCVLSSITIGHNTNAVGVSGNSIIMRSNGREEGKNSTRNKQCFVSAMNACDVIDSNAQCVCVFAFHYCDSVLSQKNSYKIFSSLKIVCFFYFCFFIRLVCRNFRGLFMWKLGHYVGCRTLAIRLYQFYCGIAGNRMGKEITRQPYDIWL